MKLKTRTFSVSLISVTVLLIILFLFINPLLLERYIELEERTMSDNIKRVEYAFEREKNSLYQFVRDYAVWDDTYSFIQHHQQSYIESNWVEDTYLSNSIEMVMYFDESNELVYERGYDIKEEELVSIINKIDSSVLEEFLTKRKTGVVYGEDDILMLASHPIYPSLENQTPRGTMITGIAITDQFVEQLADAVQLPLVLNERIDPMLTNEKSIDIIDEESIKGSMILPYENHSETGNLSFTVNRTIYQSGQKSLYWFYSIYAGFSIVLTTIILMILDKHILSRVINLSKEFKYIKETQDLSRRVSTNKKDEIGVLENGYNHMLDVLNHSQKEIHDMAMIDGLTGLPNRKSFVDQLERDSKQLPMTIMFLDIDLFKRINDSFGHYAGDTLLIEFGKRLKTCLGEEGTVGRWGGDEFVLGIPKLDEETISTIAKNLLKTISVPVNIGTSSFEVTTSIGISQFPIDDRSVEKVIQNADIAMYEAKRSGKNQYQYYKNIKKSAYFHNFVTLEKELTEALNNDEFVLYFQPIVDKIAKTICSVEALIRWQHPNKGLIPPDEFISAAEEIGMMPAIGEWVLKEGIRQLKEWHEMGLVGLTLSINVSKTQMMDEKFISFLIEQLKYNKMDPSFIALEITESDVSGSLDKVVEFTSQLKEIGMKVSLDDFGKGLSSLNFLKEIQVDQLKIDRLFIQNIPAESFDTALLSGIVALCEGLNIDVVTEGVETKAQLDFLVTLETKMQGYYFSKPVPPIEMKQQLEAVKEKVFGEVT